MGRWHGACTSGEGLKETGPYLRFILDSLLLVDRKGKKGQEGGEQSGGHASGQVLGALDMPDSKEVGKTGNWMSNSEGTARVPGD